MRCKYHNHSFIEIFEEGNDVLNYNQEKASKILVNVYVLV